jgi:hypothetical protein
MGKCCVAEKKEINPTSGLVFNNATTTKKQNTTMFISFYGFVVMRKRFVCLI